MYMYDRIKFTLDNLIYNSISKGKDDIEIILPRGTPTTSSTYSSKYTQESSTLVKAVDQIKIKLFLTTSDVIPKLYIRGESSKSKLSYANALEIIANAINLITFTTTDGGTTWLISSSAFTKTPESSSNIVREVNGMQGPTIIVDAENIHMKGNEGPTISSTITEVKHEIITLKETVVSEVTNDVVQVLPDMIKLQINDTEIIAEKI